MNLEVVKENTFQTVIESLYYSCYEKDCVQMLVKSGSDVKEVPIQLYEYKTFAKRLKGLMFRLKPIENEGLLLHPCNSIHMFFMFFSIDALFLDKYSNIVALRENIKPWTVIFPIKNAVSTLEIPVGTIAKYSLKVGHKIEL